MRPGTHWDGGSPPEVPSYVVNAQMLWLCVVFLHILRLGKIYNSYKTYDVL